MSTAGKEMGTLTWRAATRAIRLGRVRQDLNCISNGSFSPAIRTPERSTGGRSKAMGSCWEAAEKLQGAHLEGSYPLGLGRVQQDFIQPLQAPNIHLPEGGGQEGTGGCCAPACPKAVEHTSGRKGKHSSMQLVAGMEASGLQSAGTNVGEPPVHTRNVCVTNIRQHDVGKR